MATQNEILKERLKLVERIKEIQKLHGKEAAKLDKTYIKTKARLQAILKLERESATSARSQVNSMYDLKDTLGSLSTVYNKIKKSISAQALKHMDILGSIKIQRNSAKGLTDLQEFQAQITESVLKHYKDQSSLALKLSQLSEEDELSKAHILDDMKSIQSELEGEVELLDKRSSIAKDFLEKQSDIEAGIKAQTNEAKSLSSIDSKNKDILESQAKVIKNIKTKITALGATLSTFLKRPQTAFGALITASGFVTDNIVDTNKKLGFTIRDVNLASTEAGLLSFAFDDTAGTVKSLSSELGSLSAATLTVQTNVGLIASTMGSSNTEAVSLIGSFSRVNGDSTSVATNMIATTKEFAKQNHVIPSAVLSDLADSAEAFALYAKNGGDNIIKAGVYAQKLGTNMSTLTGVADSLLDFQSSIASELQLSALLGRNINLNKARQLAYDGDLKEATTEALKQLGGIDSFNRMDVFQRKAAAEAIGLSVTQLQKMLDHQKHIGESGQVIKKTFSEWGTSIDAGLNKVLGTSLKGLGAIVASTGQFNLGLQSVGLSVGGILKGTLQIGKNMLGMIPKIGNVGKRFGSIGNTKLGKALGGFKNKLFKGVDSNKQSSPKIGKGTTSLTDSIQKLKPPKLLAGAAAMVVAAGAVFVFGKAVQEFMKVSWNAVGKAVVSMAVLIGGVILLGTVMSEGMVGPLLVGVAAMVVVAGSMLILGNALQSIGNGFEILEKSIGPLLSTVSDSATVASSIITLGIGLGSLALGLTTLGLATPFALLAMIPLNQLSTMGPGLTQTSAALLSMGKSLDMIATQLDRINPAKLDALSNFSITASIGNTVSGLAEGIGGLINSVGDLLGGKKTESVSDYETQMLSKMDTLIAEVKSKRDVYLDKDKVTSSVMKHSEKQTGNSFGLSVA